NCRRPLVGRMHDEAGDFAGPIHLALKLIKQHEDTAVFINTEALKFADNFKILPVDLHMITGVLAKIRGQDAAQHDGTAIARPKTTAGQHTYPVEYRTV